MENNYFISALTNYVDSLPNRNGAYYMGSNCINYYTLVNFLFTDTILCNNIMNVNENYICCQLECWTDEELDFWRDVFRTFAEINGTKVKSDKQIIKWLKNPHSDSAEYKMWGNGVALPCVYYVLSRIAKEKERNNRP